MSNQPTDYKALWEAAQAKVDRLQVELNHSNQRWEHIINNAGDSIFIISPADYTIQQANSHAARRLGYTDDELVGMSLDDIEVNDDNATTMQVAWMSEASGTQVYECYHRHKEGYLIPVEVSSRVVELDGQEVLLNFVRNIEVRKKLEAEREQLIADLDAYAHTVAHDLKNPLATVLGYASLLSDDFAYMDVSNEAKDLLAAIVQGSLKLQRIIEELLLLAKIRTIDDVEPTPLNMGEIVRESLARLTVMIHERHAEIIMPENDEWAVALGHSAWVEEIWANYISNAIKYGGTPPQITLGCEIQDPKWVCFWVSDNGHGLSPDEQARLFKQFTRLDGSSNSGEGLGLSIVKRIAEKMKGRVGVESVVGQGSTFYFILPAAT